MKLLMAVALALTLIFSVSYSMTTQCGQFTNEVGCDDSECAWCDRCSGKEINNYGADRCVDSNLQCTYSCSKTCGANCTADIECSANLTDTTCFYAGRCSACNCSYLNASCPKNGTIREQYGNPTDAQGAPYRICYYGARYCTSSGCSVNSCSLREGLVCDPADGCVPCEGCSGDEFVIDKKCSGDDVTGKKISYFCYGGQCNVTSSVYLEKCKNGCHETDDAYGVNRPKCNDETCNIDGINTNCNVFDGYYSEAYCKGADVYKGYRDYTCGTNECIYTNSEAMLERCNKTMPSGHAISCQNGRCYDSGVVIDAGTVTDGTQETKTQKSPLPDDAPEPLTLFGGRLYNGFLFGQNDIRVNARGQSGKISFRLF